MFACKDCGNTDKFLAGAVIHDTAVVDDNGEFLDWTSGSGYSSPDIKKPSNCAECGSSDIVEVSSYREREKIIK